MKNAPPENALLTIRIIALLKKEYPNAGCTLDFRTPHQLLVATILSAQCTDERVNTVTKDLFRKYKKPDDYAKVTLSRLENDIRPTGLFRNKAKAIKESAKIILNDYGGRMPDRMEELTKLPGVGRKTALVVLGAAFDKAEGIAVDTHVSRLSQRFGLTCRKGAEEIEEDLMKIISRNNWIIFSHLLIAHGREVCKARQPDCRICVLSRLCPSEKTFA